MHFGSTITTGTAGVLLLISNAGDPNAGAATDMAAVALVTLAAGTMVGAGGADAVPKGAGAGAGAGAVIEVAGPEAMTREVSGLFSPVAVAAAAFAVWTRSSSASR